jgi:predicted Ser/Thr protein kinase
LQEVSRMFFEKNFDEYDEVKNLSPNRDKGVWLIQNVKNGELAVKKKVPTENLGAYRRLVGKNFLHIPYVYTVDDDGFIYEEYVYGRTLDEVLHDGALSVKQTKKYAIELCDACICLHELNIIHRDIKPKNIIISDSDNLFLIDYDAARIYDEANSGDTKNIGTMGYAAPEQFGFSQSDARTDVYAIGGVMNEMLTQKLVVQKSTDNAEMERIISKATNVSPKKRYSSAKALKADIQNGVNSDMSKFERAISKVPGFRTKKLWKMIAAIIIYIFGGIKISADLWQYAQRFWYTKNFPLSMGIIILFYIFIIGLPYAIVTNLLGCVEKIPVFVNMRLLPKKLILLLFCAVIDVLLFAVVVYYVYAQLYR